MNEKLTVEQIAEIIESHGKWLRGEEGGKRADFSFKDCRDANFVGANCRGANFVGANCRGANFEGARIWSTNLSETNLDGRWVVVAQIGSRKGTTYYDKVNDITRCGCFKGTLDEFAEAVEREHSDHPQYLAEYRAAITYIKAICEIEIIENEED